MTRRPFLGMLAATAIVLAVASLSGRADAIQNQPPTTPPVTPPATPTPPASPDAPQQQRPVFRTGADLVRVDVVVLDRKGVPVSNLKAEDFELEDEGEPQEIKSFQYVTADGQPDADNELSLTIRSKSHAAAEASRDNVRVFLIFWDEYHIGQIASAVRARTSLMQFVRTAFGPTDIVAFMDPLTPIDALVFTRDRLELFDRTRKLIGRSGVYVPTRSAVEDAHLQRGDIERLRSEVTISALKAAAMHLGGLRDGRKSIILVSEGLRGLRDFQDPLNDLVRSANANNTAIYALDPRGFGPQRFGSLFEGVAVDTGGEYFRSNDLLTSMQAVVTQSSGFYLLGYSAAERATDGKYHKLRVKVKGSGLEVRARAGYWAPSVADMTRAKTRAAEAELPPDMTRAFLDLPKPTARRTIDLWVGASLQADRPMVRLAWQPRPQTDGGPAATHVSVLAEHGQTKVFDGPVDRNGIQFEAPPGPLRVAVNALDKTNEIIDRDVRTVVVPDPAAPGLQISAPAVFRTQSALERRNLDLGPEAVPYPGREFLRTDRLHIRFALLGAAAPTASVTARLISQWGKDLAALPLVARTSPDAPYDIELPLSSVARGEFLIAITATAGDQSTRVMVPIRVTR
jgi:VWFA-related protein